MSQRGQAILIWWTIGFLAVWGFALIFLVGMFPPPPATLSAQDVAAFYTVHRMRILLGATVGSATGAFMVPMVAVVCYQMIRLGKEFYVWALLEAGGGFVTSIFNALPSLFWGVAAFSPGRPPEITKAFHETAVLSLVTTDQLFLFHVLAIAWVAFNKKPDPYSAFPRWLGYLALWEFLISEIAIVGFLTKTGPFAWNGLFVFWLPVAIFGPWIGSISYTMLRASKHQAAQGV